MNGQHENSEKESSYNSKAPSGLYGLSRSGVDDPSLRRPPAVHQPSSPKSEQEKDLSQESVQAEVWKEALRDPQKEVFVRWSMQSQTDPPPTSVASTDDGQCAFEDANDDPKRHTLWILVYLSGLAFLLALPIALYTLFITTILLLGTPIVLLCESRPLGDRYQSLLAPLRNFQLGLIFSPFESSPPEFDDSGSIPTQIFVHLLAPLYAVVIAMAAWVGGFFWFYTAILGNPDGKEERDDGRETVYTVREWWENYLIQGMSRERSSSNVEL